MCVRVRSHSATVCVSSLQLLAQTSVGFPQQDELLVQQKDVLLQFLAAAQLQRRPQQQLQVSQQQQTGAELGAGCRGRPHLDGQLGELVLSIVHLVVGLLQLGLRVAQPAATVLEFALGAAQSHTYTRRTVSVCGPVSTWSLQVVLAFQSIKRV